jgi:hypothetical protein
MSDLQHLFQQYIQLREAGHDSPAVVKQLWSQIKVLPDAGKQALKADIRAWERQDQPAPAPPPTPVTPTIRRIAIEPGTEEKDEPELVERFCLHCGRLNRAGEVVCYACGNTIDPYSHDPQHTQVLQLTTGLFYSDEFFGDDFVLLLTLRGDRGGTDDAVFELRPQEFQREIHIGRLAYGSETIPDIDLSEYDAESRGVSRIHLNLFHDPGDSVIRIVDRASANGTFVNGQRLHRNEVRVLRNGDDIRLGRLVLSAKFYTPNFG